MNYMSKAIMVIATTVVTMLVAVSWLLMRISSWIVNHDAVWGLMDSEYAGFEHMIAEVFHQARLNHLLLWEAICGVIFLDFLWHHCSRYSQKVRSKGTEGMQQLREALADMSIGADPER